MGTQWARQEAKKNELAVWVDKATLWVKFHPQPAIWAGVGVLAVVLLCVGFVNRTLGQKEDAWAKLAMIQSYAYAGQPQSALEQAGKLSEEYPSSPAADFGQLLTGDILFEQGKYKEAVQAYQKILDRPSAKALAPMALADLELTQEAAGDYKAAADMAQKFLETYADHFMAPPVHGSLARCLAALGEKDKAKAALERIAFLYPQTYWADWAKARSKG
jgi:tetratricopeptide (TPR) repeat protein